MPPDKTLNEEFLKSLGLTANGLAQATGVSANRITGRKGNLEALFKTSAGFWMNLQLTCVPKD
jgi:plasmid maintenance system antidote protein VapI